MECHNTFQNVAWAIVIRVVLGNGYGRQTSQPPSDFDWFLKSAYPQVTTCSGQPRSRLIIYRARLADAKNILWNGGTYWRMNQPATVVPTHKRWHTYSPAPNIHSPVHMKTWLRQHIPQSMWLNTGIWQIWRIFQALTRRRRRRRSDETQLYVLFKETK